jgi:MFS family permease
MLGMSIIGRLLGGILGMRYESHCLAGFFFGVMGLGLVALLFAQGIGFAYLYSILAGLGFGGAIVLMPNMLGAYFGRGNYSRIVGWITPIMTVASAISPPLAGYLYDETGTYRWIIVACALLIFAAMLLAFTIRPPENGKTFTL